MHVEGVEARGCRAAAAGDDAGVPLTEPTAANTVNATDAKNAAGAIVWDCTSEKPIARPCTDERLSIYRDGMMS